jgi:DNA-binding NarL/FixJ family response regulator
MPPAGPGGPARGVPGCCAHGRADAGTDGITATRRIWRAAPRRGVLSLTTFDLDEYVYAGRRAGASGFRLEDALAPELVFTSRAAVSGEAMAPTVPVVLRTIHRGRAGIRTAIARNHPPTGAGNWWFCLR